MKLSNVALISIILITVSLLFPCIEAYKLKRKEGWIAID